jgi:hypothetical protein
MTMLQTFSKNGTGQSHAQTAMEKKEETKQNA